MRAMQLSRPDAGWVLPFFLLLSLGCLLPVMTACSSYPVDATPTFSATAMARMDTAAYGVDARRNAITFAELHAREKLMHQVMQLRLNDGRIIEDVAILDPFLRAVIDDAIRGANVSDRTFSEEGIVTVTMKVGLEPILDMLDEYSPQLAEGMAEGQAQSSEAAAE